MNRCNKSDNTRAIDYQQVKMRQEPLWYAEWNVNENKRTEKWRNVASFVPLSPVNREFIGEKHDQSHEIILNLVLPAVTEDKRFC